MKKNIFCLLTVLLCLKNIYAQPSYQTFESAGFKVKSECRFDKNTTFIQMAKQKGMSNILAAYVCAENPEDPQIGVIKNINIYDESSNYRNLKPSEYTGFEEKYLEQYESNLKASGINYNFTTYLGVPAIEYAFSQQGLPTKAIVFLKERRSYLIQVGSRNNLKSNYTSLKSSFIIL